MSNFRNRLSSLKNRLLTPSFKGYVSYSQIAEDLIVNYVFEQLRIEKPTYLDIGANDPVNLSNTYFFYKKGCRGVCIEPNPSLVKKFKQKRPGDQVLEVGVSIDGRSSADYYMMDWHEFNTFSEERAKEIEAHYAGQNNIQKKITRKLMTIMEVCDAYFPSAPNFVNLDVEGLDFEILKQIDFSRVSPDAFCVETISTSDTGYKDQVSLLFEEKGYFQYAFTRINSIFVKSIHRDKL